NGKISLDSLGEKSFEAKYLSDNPNEKEIDHINIKVYVKEINEPEKIKEKRGDYGYFSIISQNKKVEEINKEEKNIVLKEIVLKINSKKFLVDGQEKLNDTPPIILNNRTMVPIRFIGESLGAKIEWDEKNSLVRIKEQKKKVTIEIKIGENLARVNGKEVKLTNPIFIKNNRAYGLLRFIGESLGAKVEWFKDDQKIVITK
ncbi:copper amine oxidase N-terminal domain-containing protein, partial [Peptoniphilus sp. BV3C26]